MDRITEIEKRIKKSNNLFLINKHEFDSLKKITKSYKISDYEVLTDDGFVDIVNLHETIPYEVYSLKLSDGKELECADNHIVFLSNMEEIFVKDLNIGDEILVNSDNNTLVLAKVIEVTNLGHEEVMYDLELTETSKRRYYTNGILSHNTLLSKLLAKEVFGSEDALIRLDMSEFMEKHTVTRLIGAPPSYVGYEEGGKLTEAVRRKPYSVILLDEVEKAHPDVFNIFLQIFDEGHVTDSLGRKINFKNTIIIMTSNIGSKEVTQFGNGMGFGLGSANKQEQHNDLINKALKDKFRPEFLNRIDEIITFNSLSNENICKIVDLELLRVSNQIKEAGYILKYNKDVTEFIASVGFDPVYGARPIARAIQTHVEDVVTDEILNGNVKEGETINLSMDKEKKNVIVKALKGKK